MMSDDFTLKSHDENFINLQRQDSFHVKKLKFYFEIHRQIFILRFLSLDFWREIVGHHLS